MQTMAALSRVPLLMFSMIRAVLQMKKKRREFIHTPKSFTSEGKDSSSNSYCARFTGMNEVIANTFQKPFQLGKLMIFQITENCFGQTEKNKEKHKDEQGERGRCFGAYTKSGFWYGNRLSSDFPCRPSWILYGKWWLPTDTRSDILPFVFVLTSPILHNKEKIFPETCRFFQLFLFLPSSRSHVHHAVMPEILYCPLSVCMIADGRCSSGNRIHRPETGILNNLRVVEIFNFGTDNTNSTDFGKRAATGDRIMSGVSSVSLFTIKINSPLAWRIPQLFPPAKPRFFAT